MAGLHSVLSASLRAGAECGSVAEHFGKRNVGVDLPDTAGLRLVADDLSAALDDISHDVAHVGIRHDYGDLHDRLGKGRVRLSHSFLESH